ncbi:MAG: YraN family protein [Microbacteriaceae bacterium]|nr:YraN family protein [Microbacteriaceae bacterium]
MAAKDDLGRRGEALATEFLRQHGCAVLAQNWRCAQGEIDVIVLDGAETVFVEVKTRSSVTFGHPFEAITAAKLARLRRLAGAWCEANPSLGRQIRIDAISVIAPLGATPQLEHLRRVF